MQPLSELNLITQPPLALNRQIMSSDGMSRPKLIEIVNLNNKENSSTLLLQMKRQQQQQHRMKCAKHFQSQYSLPLMVSSACSSSRSSPLSMSPLPSLNCAFFANELFDYQSESVRSLLNKT